MKPTITPEDDGSIRVKTEWGSDTWRFPADVTQALREHFLREADAKYKRWRDPENPNMVAYLMPTTDDDGSRSVRLVDETTGVSSVISERHQRHCFAPDAPLCRTAGRYFSAHPLPDPDPWDEGRLGEIWELTINHNTCLYRRGANGLYSLEHGRLLAQSPIRPTAGRRIWPEPEERKQVQ